MKQNIERRIIEYGLNDVLDRIIFPANERQGGPFSPKELLVLKHVLYELIMAYRYDKVCPREGEE